MQVGIISKCRSFAVILFSMLLIARIFFLPKCAVYSASLAVGVLAGYIMNFVLAWFLHYIAFVSTGFKLLAPERTDSDRLGAPLALWPLTPDYGFAACFKGRLPKGYHRKLFILSTSKST